MGHQKKKQPIAYPPLYDYNIQNMIRYGTIRGLVLAILPAGLLVFLIVRAYMMWFAGEIEFPGTGQGELGMLYLWMFACIGIPVIVVVSGVVGFGFGLLSGWAIGLYIHYFDPPPPDTRAFRYGVTQAAMIAVGLWCFSALMIVLGVIRRLNIETPDPELGTNPTAAFMLMVTIPSVINMIVWTAVFGRGAYLQAKRYVTHVKVN